MKKRKMSFFGYFTKEYGEYLQKKKIKRKNRIRENKLGTGLKTKVTHAQAVQRLKFGMVTAFLAKIKIALDISFINKQNSPLNKAAKINFKSAIIGNYPDLLINYPMIIISCGRLGAIYYSTLTISVSGKGQMDWENPVGYNFIGDDTDQIFLLIYNSSKEKVLYADYTGKRSDQSVAFDVPAFKKSDKLHCWIFLKSESDKVFSDSEYVDDVIILD